MSPFATHSGESIDFGFLGALESDADFSEGRQFMRYARKNGENYSVGYLGTLADRRFLTGQQQSTVDWLYRPSKPFD